jgi:hypothetical protein
MPNRAYWFAGGASGEFRVRRMTAVIGEPIAEVARVTYRDTPTIPVELEMRWVFRGVTSNQRYTTSREKAALVARSPDLGRPWAALIVIKKSDAWWNLAQDERREIFEEQSRHTTIGLRYLPAVARRLHHCRDLGTEQAFDFLTWFEFAKKDTADFDRLLARLRTSEEWKYVDREVEIRVEHDNLAATNETCAS